MDELELNCQIYRCDNFLLYFNYLGLWKAPVTEEKESRMSYQTKNISVTPLLTFLADPLCETFEPYVKASKGEAPDQYPGWI